MADHYACRNIRTRIELFFAASLAVALDSVRSNIPYVRNIRELESFDAAHAMLPTQGQGASQSFEDAEAPQSFFSDVHGRPSYDGINSRLLQVFDARHRRATLIQQYSRQQARAGTALDSKKINLRPDEFMDYNSRDTGAKEWVARQSMQQPGVSGGYGSFDVLQ